MEIKELQERVDAWIREYGVRYFSELTNMACLTEEVGELARVMARKYGDQSFKAGEKENLADEMADVLWVLVCLANQTGVDLTAAVEANCSAGTDMNGRNVPVRGVGRYRTFGGSDGKAAKQHHRGHHGEGCTEPRQGETALFELGHHGKSFFGE